MSSGAALSTPREHLTNIENALKVTGQLAANARVGIATAGSAYPLGPLLTNNEVPAPKCACLEWL